MQEFKPLVLRF